MDESRDDDAQSEENQGNSRDAWAHRRFATRIPGDGWTARIPGLEGEIRVLNLSRIGITLETAQPLTRYQRFSLKLAGPSGTTETQFYVLRCTEIRHAGGRRIYRPAGIFVATLPREDLPEAIPESPRKIDIP